VFSGFLFVDGVVEGGFWCRGVALKNIVLDCSVIRFEVVFVAELLEGKAPRAC